LYRLGGDKLGVSLRQVAFPPAVGKAALEALLAGTNAAQKAASLYTLLQVMTISNRIRGDLSGAACRRTLGSVPSDLRRRVLDLVVCQK